MNHGVLAVNMQYNSHIRVVEVDCSGWQLLAKLGGPGFLKGIGVTGSDTREHYIKVQCNDTVIGKGLISASTSNSYENSGITFDIPFDNEIKIYGMDTPANTDPNDNVFHRYWITLTTGHLPVQQISD